MSQTLHPGMEKYAPSVFFKKYSVFKPTKIVNTFTPMEARVELPVGSVLHVMDNFQNITRSLGISDIPDLDNCPFVANEQFKKYVYHTRRPVVSPVVIKTETNPIYRDIGLSAALQKFRSTYGSKYLFADKLEQLDVGGNFLGIVNHNPIFRTYVRGKFAHWDSLNCALQTILNSACKLPNKQNYVLVPMSEYAYIKSIFDGAYQKISVSALNRGDSRNYQFLFLVQWFNFVNHAPAGSIFDLVPQSARSTIDIAFWYGSYLMVWNLADAFRLNIQRQMNSRIIKQMNSFIAHGYSEEAQKQIPIEELVVGDPEETPQSDITKVNSTATVVEKTTENTDTTESSTKETDDSENIDQSHDLENTVSDLIAATKRLDAAAPAIRESDPVAQAIEDDKSGDEKEPVIKHPFAEQQALVIDQSQVFYQNTPDAQTALYPYRKPITPVSSAEEVHALGVEFIDELDAAAQSHINRDTGLTAAQKDRAKRLAAAYKSITFDGKPLATIITEPAPPVPNDEKLPELLIDQLVDKSMSTASIANMPQHYMNHFYRKHLVEVACSFNKFGMYLTGIQTTKNITPVTSVNNYVFKYQTATGKQSTIKFSMPHVFEDGTCLVNGVRCYLKPQMVNLPICKVSPTRVNLSSNRGKTFVKRETAAARSFISYFNKLIGLVGSANPSLQLTRSAMEIPATANVPYEYRQIGSVYSSITATISGIGKQITFNFPHNNEALSTDETIKKLKNKFNGVFIGEYLNEENRRRVMIMTLDSVVHIVDAEKLGATYHRVSSVMDILASTTQNRIKLTVSPYEWTEIKILNKKFPIGFILCYRYGLLRTLAMLGVSYKFVPKHTGQILRFRPTDIAIPFKDKTLVFNRYPLKVSYILSGIALFNTNAWDAEVFETKDVYAHLLMEKKYRTNLLKDIDDAFELFIDPQTAETLKQMHEPTEFGKLVVRATELLVVETHDEAAAMKNHRLRSYDRMPAILYNELARAYSAYSKRGGAGNTFSVNPYSILQRILQDQSMLNVEDINPIHDIKMTHGITYTGAGGRTQESFVTDDRRFPKDGIGVISEATADSGNVSITATLSMDPKISNVYGFIDDTKTPEKLNPTNILSVATLLMPATTQDDGKRANFVSVQLSHTMPTEYADVSRVRTGFEKVIAHRSSDIFALTAKQDGIVVDVNDKLKLIKIRYTDGTTKVFSSDTQIGYCSDITTEQEQVVTVKKGDKFKKGDVLRYNPKFFAPNSTLPRQVDYKTGLTCTVALVDNSTTFEDSNVITEEVGKKLSIRPIEIRDIAVDKNTLVHHCVAVGDTVNVTDPLMIFEDASVVDLTTVTADEYALEYLAKLNRHAPKAGSAGEIVKIETYHGCDVSDMHETLANIVRKTSREKNAAAKYASGSASEERFIPQTKLPLESKFKGFTITNDTVIVRFLIRETVSSGVGDKIVIDSSLKTVSCKQVKRLSETESGVPVDIHFSAISISKRIVNSPIIVGMLERVLEYTEQKMINLYFDK